MKKSIFFAAFLFIAAMSVKAQDDTTKLEKAGRAVDKTATKGAHKTAELASKGKSAIVDNVYKDKTGPDGQTVYIDHSSKYYYVNAKGKKVYVKESELKSK